MDPDADADNEAVETDGDKLKEVHERALKRFDAAAVPQAEIRAHALLCRRFISIPGAMWEGEWGDQFANSIRVEIDKLSKGVEKLVQDYRSNRIVPDFRPSGPNSDPETANTLDGLHRADSYHFKAQQARDNAYEEGVAGGFGAWRLVNELADEFDLESDEQRINPGAIIVDADQRVYFDPNAKAYDKSDAKHGFVLTAVAREAFEEEHPGCAADWPESRISTIFEWYTPDVVIKAEYYEVEEHTDTLVVFKHKLSDEEQRMWQDELEDGESADLKARGWVRSSQKRMRRQVRKYVMTGAEVLEDCGFIAGDKIPVVPFYCKRWFVDNQERFRGHVSKRMDAQRIYNGKVSKLAETDALAPREKPIFLAEQMPPHLAELWSKQEQERHPYALVNPVYNADGSIAAMGPIGKIEPPSLDQVAATLLQIAAADLAEETDDGADEVVANTSAEAMDIAAARIDAKSEIPLDNMKQSVQREGEVYLGMCRDVYPEAGREVETMSEDGEDGTAVLRESYTDKRGANKVRNDFTQGKYKVVVDVTEATATRRDKTVKSMLHTAAVAAEAQDIELAQVAILSAVMNQDGEGTADVQKYARKRLVGMGVVEPNEEEQQQMDEAQQNQPPDPTAILAEAQALALKASASKDEAQGQKILVDAVAAKLKPLIDAFNAETQRIRALVGKDLGPATGPGLDELVAATVRNALDTADIAPGAGAAANDTGPPAPQLQAPPRLSRAIPPQPVVPGMSA
jgi:hypothetical protein